MNTKFGKPSQVKLTKATFRIAVQTPYPLEQFYIPMT